ncbi:MAG: polysaccharide deacetylase family protein [Candidatus Nitrosopolaris sp.]
MSTIKCLSVVASMVTLAVALIFGNTFPNALSISSFENKSRLHYASSSANKVVMINFDDGHKSQLIYAKPILDKYGFKASFFIICGRLGTERSSMNWQDIAELKKDGMDIESHSMTHPNLNRLSTKSQEAHVKKLEKS